MPAPPAHATGDPAPKHADEDAMQEKPVREMTDTIVGAVVQLAIANDRAQNRHHNEVAALNRKIDDLQRVIEDQADQIRTLSGALDTPRPADDDASDAEPV